jgi:hypothetical protein
MGDLVLARQYALAIIHNKKEKEEDVFVAGMDPMYGRTRKRAGSMFACEPFYYCPKNSKITRL